MFVFQVLRGLDVINFVVGIRIAIRGKVVTTFQVQISIIAIQYPRTLVHAIYQQRVRRVVLVMSIASSARVISPFPASLVAIATRIAPALVLVTAPVLAMVVAPAILIVQVVLALVIRRQLVKVIVLAIVTAPRRPAVAVIRLMTVTPIVRLAIQNALVFAMRPLTVKAIVPAILTVHVMRNAPVT